MQGKKARCHAGAAAKNGGPVKALPRPGDRRHGAAPGGLPPGALFFLFLPAVQPPALPIIIRAAL